MEFQDRQISCIDCAQPFTFTAGEQEFYDRKGFKEEPKRCKPCREARKSRRNGPQGGDRASSGGAYAAGGGDTDDNYGNRAPRSQGDRDAGGEPRFSGGGAREMFDATCAQCGIATQVPFRPTAGRPVYCRDCFAQKRTAGGEPS
jgi:CxxC-x17-CxxC domain-containing protein